jgi:hypothetical protein
MTDLITVRVQIGVENYTRFSKTVLPDTTVNEMKQIIREHAKIAPSNGVVLISNGKPLRVPDITLSDHGICNDSMIICIISKETGRVIEQLVSNDKEEGDKDGSSIEIALECKFDSRPFGFAVWANEQGENAIVTKVSGSHAIRVGIQVGYCVYGVNDTLVYNMKHNDVLNYLKNMECPLRITFLDLGDEYCVTFPAKPLGFTVIPDREDRNAKVSKINTKEAADRGVKISSHIVEVNGQRVLGLKHQEIIDVINNDVFPIKLKFRRPPKLLMVSSSTKGKSTMKKFSPP